MKFIKIFLALLIIFGGICITLFSIPQTNILLNYYLYNSKVSLNNTNILPTEYTFVPGLINDGTVSLKNDCTEVKVNNLVNRSNDTNNSIIYTLVNNQTIILSNSDKNIFAMTKNIFAEDGYKQSMSNKEFLKKLFYITPAKIQLFMSSAELAENFTLLIAKKSVIMESTEIKTTSVNGTDFYIYKEFQNRGYTTIVAADTNNICSITVIDKENSAENTVNTIIKSARIL